MEDWYLSVCKALLIVGKISFIISFGTSGETSYGAELSGYSSITLAIMLILLMLFKYKNPMAILAFLWLLAIIGFILFSVLTHKNQIINGHVPTYYSTFIEVSMILIIIQTLVIYSSIFTAKFKQGGIISPINIYSSYLLSSLTMMCSIIIYIMLKYYTTDG
tara:strand:- start:397 stop:882 length:486 start_codon:yes stop_codon:yes gene_type:complete